MTWSGDSGHQFIVRQLKPSSSAMETPGYRHHLLPKISVGVMANASPLHRLRVLVAVLFSGLPGKFKKHGSNALRWIIRNTRRSSRRLR
jgi:hypothetical protein